MWGVTFRITLQQWPWITIAILNFYLQIEDYDFYEKRNNGFFQDLWQTLLAMVTISEVTVLIFTFESIFMQSHCRLIVSHQIYLHGRLTVLSNSSHGIFTVQWLFQAFWNPPHWILTNVMACQRSSWSRVTLQLRPW